MCNQQLDKKMVHSSIVESGTGNFQANIFRAQFFFFLQILFIHKKFLPRKMAKKKCIEREKNVLCSQSLDGIVKILENAMGR